MRPEKREAPPTAFADGEAPVDWFGQPDQPVDTTETSAVKPRIAGRVFDGKKLIGGVVQTAAGFVAWHRVGKAGTFDTYGAAESAVRAAHRADVKAHAQARKTPPTSGGR